MFKMNLQFFAEPAPAAPEDPDTNTSGTNSNSQPEPAAIDYEKIQQMLEGTLAAKEDTALKAYFRQQGLSQQEVEQAIATFKEQKAANQPDVAGMQNNLLAAQQEAQNARIESAATIAAVALGIDAKTIPYVLKMADLSQVMGKDGKINDEAMTQALNKVLEDVPGLKPVQNSQRGFTQIGTGGNPAQNPQNPAQSKPTVASKRWNRWN